MSNDLKEPVPEIDDDEAWLRPRKRGIRIPGITLALAVLVVLALGFVVGAQVQRHHGTASTASSKAAAFSPGGATGFGSGGFPSRSTTSAVGGTTGTLTRINGRVLTLTTSAHKAVTVDVTAATVVTRTGKGTTDNLSVGDGLTVAGKTAVNGAITATSITATQKGVTAATPSFPGAGAAPATGNFG